MFAVEYKIWTSQTEWSLEKENHNTEGGLDTQS